MTGEGWGVWGWCEGGGWYVGCMIRSYGCRLTLPTVTASGEPAQRRINIGLPLPPAAGRRLSSTRWPEGNSHTWWGLGLRLELGLRLGLGLGLELG